VERRGEGLDSEATVWVRVRGQLSTLRLARGAHVGKFSQYDWLVQSSNAAVTFKNTKSC